LIFAVGNLPSRYEPALSGVERAAEKPGALSFKTSKIQYGVLGGRRMNCIAAAEAVSVAERASQGRNVQRFNIPPVRTDCFSEKFAIESAVTIFLILNFLLSHQRDHNDGNSDWQYQIKPQRARERRRERLVKCLTDLFHLTRHQPSVDLSDAFNCTRLFQEFLLNHRQRRCR
jgi:hypothetical protein